MIPFGEILVAALLVIGGLFGLLGSFGLIRLRDPMQRLHAPTKASTLGLAGVLTGSVAYFWLFQGQLTWQELLITIFVIVTAPITAHFVAKVHLYKSTPRRDLPPTGTPRDWATLEQDD